MSDIRAAPANDYFGFWEAVVFFRGYCIFRFICAAVATVWLVRLGHASLGFCALIVAWNNVALRWHAHRGVRGKLRDERNRPILVLTAKTAFAWLLLAAALWWCGW